MKAKEIELGLREHSIDRIEKENVRLKEQIKMINFKEMELNSKEKTNVIRDRFKISAGRTRELL